MSLSIYLQKTKPCSAQQDVESQQEDVESQQEALPPRPATVIIPLKRFGFYWSQKAVAVTDNNVNQLLLELDQALPALDSRTNFYDNGVFYTSLSAGFLVAMAGVAKVAENRATNTTESDNTPTNISLDSVVLASPLISTFIIAVLHRLRDSMLQRRQQAVESTDSLRPYQRPRQ